MKSVVIQLVLTVLPMLLVMLPTTGNADSFRCGRKVISTGDSSRDLVEKCGDPQSRDSGQEEIWLNREQLNVRVERWHYKEGNSKLGRVVLVYRGEVVGVQTGNR